MARRRTLEEASKHAEKLSSYIQKIQICPMGLMQSNQEEMMRTENQASPIATEKYNQAILALLANKTEENFRPPFSLEITDSESGKCLYETKIEFEFDGEEPRWVRNYPRHEGPVFINVIGHCKMSQLVTAEKLKEASAAD